MCDFSGVARATGNTGKYTATTVELNDRQAMADVQMDIYEDMFKEITKKIYGQDSSSSEDRQFADQDAFKMVEEGLSMIDSDDAVAAAAAAAEAEAAAADAFDEQPEDNPWVTSDETISWTTSKIVSYNAEKKLFKCQECNSVGMLSSVAEHWLGTHADVKVCMVFIENIKKLKLDNYILVPIALL